MTTNAKESLLSRRHVLRMTMLSRRAVHYSIKSYTLNNLESCRLVAKTKQDLCDLEASIGGRGRNFISTGAIIDSHSLLACGSLRIFSSLRVILMAANEIAQNVRIVAVRGRETMFPQTVESGNLVNRLVRVCSMALFKQDVQLAQQLLRVDGGRKRLDVALYRARLDLLRASDANCKCELAVVHCLSQIAEQVYETAESIIVLLECRGYVPPEVRLTVKSQWISQHRFSQGKLGCSPSSHAQTLP